MNDFFSHDVAAGLREALEPFAGLGFSVTASVWWCGEWRLEYQMQVNHLIVACGRIGGVGSAASVTSEILDHHGPGLESLYAMQGGASALQIYDQPKPRPPSSAPYLVE